MNRVVQYQQPDGTWVQQVVDVPDVRQQPTQLFAPLTQPNISVEQVQQQVHQFQQNNLNVTLQRPIEYPQPRLGVWGTTKATLNGDLRWNPVARRYEPVFLDRPERTGIRKALFGR